MSKNKYFFFSPLHSPLFPSPPPPLLLTSRVKQLQGAKRINQLEAHSGKNVTAFCTKHVRLPTCSILSSHLCVFFLSRTKQHGYLTRANTAQETRRRVRGRRLIDEEVVGVACQCVGGNISFVFPPEANCIPESHRSTPVSCVRYETTCCVVVSQPLVSRS